MNDPVSYAANYTPKDALDTTSAAFGAISFSVLFFSYPHTRSYFLGTRTLLLAVACVQPIDNVVPSVALLLHHKGIIKLWITGSHELPKLKSPSYRYISCILSLKVYGPHNSSVNFHLVELVDFIDR
jgi:hypothetical protein